VAAVELVTSEGDVLQISRGDDDFEGMVVSLGALGVVTRLTLDVQPSYQMRQDVFEHLPWDVLFTEFDAVMASADSVSLFTDFGDTVGQLWRKSRVAPDLPHAPVTECFGAKAAIQAWHPVPTLPADSCTEQLGVPGPWAERLPHFRMDAVPASGNELQSEYMMSRNAAVAALQAVRSMSPTIRPLLWTAEIRTVAADELWMSPAYRTDTVCLHFSWKFDPDAVSRVLPILEEALTPFRPRPHWGKLFVATAQGLQSRYERLADFRRLVERMDPRGAFRNAFLGRHVLG
jgi:xylitol oxidase